MTPDDGPGDPELTHSVWQDRTTPDVGTPLRDDARVDVCVIGAGIAGLSTAYMLARDDVDVLVIDRRHVGAGETKRSTAHLSNAIDDRYHWLEQVHGRAVTRLAAESQTAAIDRIEANVRDEGIDCGFKRIDGYLFPAEGQPPEELDHELHAARSAGITDAEMVDRVPVPGRNVGAGIRFPRQGQVDPLAYINGLARAIERRGGRVATDAYVTRVQDGTPVTIETTRGVTIRCNDCVVATNTPITDTFGVHTKQMPYRTYVISAPVPKGRVEPGLYWDTATPYHFARLTSDPDGGDDILIVGGEDHKTGHQGDPTARWARLESWSRTHFPVMGDVSLRWSGQVYEPVDGLAFIGRDPGSRHVYFATGDSGQGITHGTIAGIILADAIQGRDNRWAHIYDPGRIMVSVSRSYLRENLDVAEHYGDYFTRGDVVSEDLIQRGRGAIVRRGVKKVAVYRDEKGETHAMSAVCKHLGCIVKWNLTESTWDCPCHGSRYDAHGRVMNGPATEDLDPVAEQPRRAGEEREG